MGKIIKANEIEIIENSKGYIVKCPKCKKNYCFALNNVEVPFDFKIFFINFKIKIYVSLKYCPNCGYLKISLK